MMRLSRLTRTSVHARLWRPRHHFAMFATGAGDDKWRVFQTNLKDAIARSDLPVGLDKLLLQAFDLSKKLKLLMEQNKPLEQEMLAVLTILPVHHVVQWMQEADDQAKTKEAKLNVHSGRFSRWLQLGKIQGADMADAEQNAAVMAIWRDILQVQRQDYSEPIAVIDPSHFDELNRDFDLLHEKRGSDLPMLHVLVLARVAKTLSTSSQIPLLLEPPLPEHQEIGLGVTLPSGPVAVVGVLGCEDMDEGVVRVLTKCEVEINKRVERTHEVVGVVSTKDKWVFLRSQDERILIDDSDNILQYRNDQRPTRESVERIMGKLRSLLSGPQ